LFDRDDYLQPAGGHKDEMELEEDMSGTTDPRLFDQSRVSQFLGLDVGSSRAPSRSVHQGPYEQSHGQRHIGNRQSIVDQVHFHSNLRNMFGNLPFSSSIRANNYHPDIQDAQTSNLFLPVWSIVPASTIPDPGSLRNAFAGILHEARSMIESGTPVEVVIETSPNIAALFDAEEYARSGLITKWAAGMVHSARLKGKCEQPQSDFISLFSAALLLTSRQATTSLHLRASTSSGC
jgi:hypothetical protein